MKIHIITVNRIPIVKISERTRIGTFYYVCTIIHIFLVYRKSIKYRLERIHISICYFMALIIYIFDIGSISIAYIIERFRIRTIYYQHIIILYYGKILTFDISAAISIINVSAFFGIPFIILVYADFKCLRIGIIYGFIIEFGILAHKFFCVNSIGQIEFITINFLIDKIEPIRLWGSTNAYPPVFIHRIKFNIAILSCARLNKNTNNYYNNYSDHKY